ncbi:protease modulator HflC [Halomonadaceae bacterium KBTZ08]
MKTTNTSIAGIVLTAVVLVILLVSSSAVFVVDQAKQAFIVRFGEIQGEAITEPGLKWKVPLIDDVRRFDKRLLAWDGDVEEIPTRGREFIIVDTTARWRIEDPRRFMESVRDEAGAQTRIDDILDSVVRDKISGAQLEEIVRSSDWDVDTEALEDEVAEREDVDLELSPDRGRQELEREILDVAEEQMPSYGIKLEDVRIKRVNYIDSVRKQVEDRMISERQSIAEKFRSEGRGRSEEILGEMQKELQTIQSEAEMEAKKLRGKADAQVTQIYGDAFGQDSEFYAFLQTLETYKDTIGDNTTLMLGADSDFYQYLENADKE